MASALARSVRRLGLAASASSSPSSSTVEIHRNFSASIRRSDQDNQKPQSQSSEEASSPSSSTGTVPTKSKDASSTEYQPPSQSRGPWPLDSQPSSDEASSSSSNPYTGLFDGSNPFPKVPLPKLSPTRTSTKPAPSEKGIWLSDQLETLSSPSPSSSTRHSRSRYETPDGRRKHSIPRSVLFAESGSTRRSDGFQPRIPSSSSYPVRRRLDRTPLTQQEANAFMSLLDQALAGTSTSPSSYWSHDEEREEQIPFGNYTSLISNPKTQSGSKALLQAFAKRNRLQRFEEAKAQRAKRFVREGLAAQIDPIELEAGVDEARESIAMCKNLGEVLEWAKKEVWGINSITTCTSTDDAEQATGATTESKGDGPKYGKDTPFYSSVLQLLFLAVRDRYSFPHVALSIPRITRWLGIESYVLGVTGSLYNEVLKTQWDWLGDLQGVVSTLRQARETGILSAPQKYSPIAPAVGEERKLMGFATSEDESIRETVDRIANEVRKFVLEQQLGADAGNKRDFSFDHMLGDPDQQMKAQGKKKDSAQDWSHKWLLANAEQAATLAGQPFRLLQKRMRDEERANRGWYSRSAKGDTNERGYRSDKYDRDSESGGERRTNSMFSRAEAYQPSDERDGSRYSGSPSYGARTSRSRFSDVL
ncbi:hypothetical protein NDA18_006607 [Ustilago nuda]|nr:hypothetical protein NDA18_006607 [Ustilago nuda]